MNENRKLYRLSSCEQSEILPISKSFFPTSKVFLIQIIPIKLLLLRSSFHFLLANYFSSYIETLLNSNNADFILPPFSFERSRWGVIMVQFTVKLY